MSSKSTSKTPSKKYIKNSYLFIYEVLEKTLLNIVDYKEPFMFCFFEDLSLNSVME